jgi:hypothetical protein
MNLENGIRDQVSLIATANSLIDEIIDISTKKIMEIIEQEKESDEKKLRYWLWLKHGHPESLYGDDGEMQCSECMLDFKRDSVEKIDQVFRKQAEIFTVSATSAKEGGEE